jgi:hypothetical protein
MKGPGNVTAWLINHLLGSSLPIAPPLPGGRCQHWERLVTALSAERRVQLPREKEL